MILLRIPVCVLGCVHLCPFDSSVSSPSPDHDLFYAYAPDVGCDAHPSSPATLPVLAPGQHQLHAYFPRNGSKMQAVARLGHL